MRMRSRVEHVPAVSRGTRHSASRQLPSEGERTDRHQAVHARLRDASGDRGERAAPVVLGGGKAGPLARLLAGDGDPAGRANRKSTRLNSSHMSISYAVFCLKKKKKKSK